jgi:small nuclear ribonucleoprotein G
MLTVSLNGDRTVEGVLRGYDQFMNVVLDNCVETSSDGERRKLGMSVVRGNSILTLEVLVENPV